MSSSVPAVVPAFISLAKTAFPAGAQVWFGTVMPVNQSGPGNVSGVASGITLQIPGIHFNEDEFAELGPSYRHEEHYNIEGLLTAWSGGQDYAQLLQDVYTEYANLTIALANNPTLGLNNPVPRLAWPRQLGVNPTPDAQGFASVQIQFEVEVQARVTSLT